MLNNIETIQKKIVGGQQLPWGKMEVHVDSGDPEEPLVVSWLMQWPDQMKAMVEYIDGISFSNMPSRQQCAYDQLEWIIYNYESNLNVPISMMILDILLYGNQGKLADPDAVYDELVPISRPRLITDLQLEVSRRLDLFNAGRIYSINDMLKWFQEILRKPVEKSDEEASKTEGWSI